MLRQLSGKWPTLAAIFALAMMPAMAQETTAGIQGTVRDATGGVVAGATVEVSGATLIGTRKVETDDAGAYRIAALPPGTYTMTVTAKGFRTSRSGGLDLSVGRMPTLDVRLEAAIAAQEHATMSSEAKIGTPSPFTCPECQGPLWEIADSATLRYRCNVGHAFTADAMLEAQAQEAEAILWKLLRAREQRAELARRVADREAEEKPALAAQFRARAAEYDEDAELVRRMLLGGIGHFQDAEPEGQTGES